MNFFKTLFTGKAQVTLKSIFGTVGGMATAFAVAGIPGVGQAAIIAAGVGGFILNYLSAHAFNVAEAPVLPLGSEKLPS